MLLMVYLLSAASGFSGNPDPDNGIECADHPLKASDDLTIVEQPQDAVTCLGGTAVFEIVASSSQRIFYSWQKVNDWIGGGYNSTLIIENVEYADTGRYHCILANEVYDSVYSDTVRLIIQDVPPVTATPEGPTSVTYSGEPEVYGIKHHPSVTGFHWKLIPDAAGTINQGDSLEVGDSIVEITFSKDFNGTAGLFVEMKQGNCRTLNSDTLWIDVTSIPDAQEICIVGLDEVTERCRIVWNKSDNPRAAFYTIYRESNEAGIFLKLATIPSDGAGVYVDSTSVPYAHTHSYRMTLTDTNGNESNPGKTHTTILLSSSLGTSGKHNLSWTHYKGYPFLTYEIYHGHSKDSMSYFISVASSGNSYIVQEPLPGSVHYQIVARREGCSPVLKSGVDYGETRSNLNLIVVHADSPAGTASRLKLNPNPADTKVLVSYTGSGPLPSELTLADMAGKVIRVYWMESNRMEIDISALSPGIYLIRLVGTRDTLVGKLLKKQ